MESHGVKICLRPKARQETPRDLVRPRRFVGRGLWLLSPLMLLGIGGCTPSRESPEHRAPVAGAQASPADPQIGVQTGPPIGITVIAADVSNRLPLPVTPSLVPATLAVDGRELISGRGLIKSTFTGSNKNTIDSIRIPNPKRNALVRLRLNKDEAQSIMGAAITAAAALQGAYLHDASGNVLNPIAYVWMRENWSMVVAIDFDFPIRSARDLPVRQMKGRDQLYLYYLANLGTTITKFRVGSTSQRMNLYVEHPVKMR